MAVKAPWLEPGGPIFALAAWTQGDMHMVAAIHGCQSAMVGTRWANCTSEVPDTYEQHSQLTMWYVPCMLNQIAGFKV